MTHTSARHLRSVFAAFLLFTLGAATPAFAIDLDQARAAGQVGERADGLVGAVTTPNPEVAALIETINKARLEAYRALAQKEGTPLDAVQAVAGERQMQAAARNGWYVMDAGGRWRKP